MGEGRFMEKLGGEKNNLFIEKSKYADEGEFKEDAEYFKKVIKRKDSDIYDFLNENSFQKNPEQIRVLEVIVESVNTILEKYKPGELKASIDDIYLLNSSAFDQLPRSEKEGTSGMCISLMQAIAISNDKCRTSSSMASTAFHELMHLYSFQRVRYMDTPIVEGAGNLFPDRNGLGIANKKEPQKLKFQGLNEAVTQKLTIQFLNSIQSNSIFAEDFATIKEHCPEYLTKGAVIGTDSDENGEEIFGFGAAYVEEVNKLDKLIGEIYADNKEKFSSPEAVFDIFAKAYFSGNIVELANLIESTKGKDSFREISENF